MVWNIRKVVILMVRIVSKRYEEILAKNDPRLEKLYFFINFCLLASHENNKSFKENALNFKDIYGILYEGFRTSSIKYTLENFDVKVNCIEQNDTQKLEISIKLFKFFL